MGNPLPSTSVPTLGELGIPNEVKELVDRETGGVVFFSGATATGKTTSITATANYLNFNQRKRIITLEDPIEYIYQNDKSWFTQRELGRDYADLSQQLEKTILRNAPDVIILSGIHHPKVLWLALKAAQWDTLVLASVWQGSAMECLESIVQTQFSPDGMETIDSMVASVPTLIVQHTAHPNEGNTGRTISYEALTPTKDMVHNLIQPNNFHLPDEKPM